MTEKTQIHFHVKMFSKVTFESSLIVSAIDDVDAVKQGWKWINKMGFKRYVVKAVPLDGQTTLTEI